MNAGAVEYGPQGGAFETLSRDEWIMTAPFAITAGGAGSATAGFEGRRRLRVCDVAGRTIGAVVLDGRAIAIPPDALEMGLAAEPTGMFEVPAEMPGGLYFIDDRWAFAVTRPGARITVVVPTSTMHSFNNWGGRSEYRERERQRAGGVRTRLHHFSLNRPLAKRFATDALAGFLDWLPKGALAGRDVGFVCDCDLARPGVLATTELLLIVGRSEYWSREARMAVDAHVARGGDMILLSSETMLYEVHHEADRCAWWWRGGPDNAKLPRTSRWTEPERAYPLLPSIGPNPGDGGHHNPEAKSHPEWGVYRAVDTASALARACAMNAGDTLPLASGVYFDGLPVARYDGDVPVLDSTALPFHKHTLVAHSFGRDTPAQRIGAWFAFQRAPTSGRVVHFGSYAWCRKDGLGGEGAAGARPAAIVDATIELLLSGSEIFG